MQKLYACMMILPSKALAALAVQGVGTAQDIDNGMKLGTNQPMGPLQLADFIGTHFIVLLLCCVATSLCTASLADFIGTHFIMLLRTASLAECCLCMLAQMRYGVQQVKYCLGRMHPTLV